MGRLSRERLLRRANAETLTIAGTSPTSAMVGALLTYFGVRLLQWERRSDAQ